MLISYAQFCEDIVLWRALKDVRNGAYIDVGANHPVDLSVTKLFYDKGWRGINIEPMAQYFDLLCQERKEDVNLQVGIGAEKGTMQFYEIEGTGLSSFDKALADKHEQHGFQVNAKEIQIATLKDICEKYVHGDIHFLKIDVEGFEVKVLQGMDFQRFRPWIVVVETMQALSGESEDNVKAQNSGQKLLEDNSYTPIYFDGCNTFYIANEKEDELSKFFQYPPNFAYDSFVLYANLQSEKTINELNQKNNVLISNNNELISQNNELKSQNKELEAKNAQQKIDILKLEEINAKLQAEYQTVIQSRSWRITKPLRFVMNLIRKSKIFLKALAKGSPVNPPPVNSNPIDWDFVNRLNKAIKQQKDA